MEHYTLYGRLCVAITFASALLAQGSAYAANQEYLAEYCTDYSVSRLIRDDNSDEMNLRDQYDLIDRYFADCMVQQKAAIRRETAYVTQPVFFN